MMPLLKTLNPTLDPRTMGENLAKILHAVVFFSTYGKNSQST